MELCGVSPRFPNEVIERVAALSFLSLLFLERESFFKQTLLCVLWCMSGRKFLQLSVMLHLKAEGFFVSAVEESHVTFVLYLVVRVTLYAALKEMERL